MYGLLYPRLRRMSLPVMGVVLGAAAMLATDAPAVGVGATRPSEWGAAGWLADIVPHLAYGVLTVLSFDAFTRPRLRARRFARRFLPR